MYQEVGMLNVHREIIKSNFKNLVDNCDIEELLPKLLEKKVFTESRIQKYYTQDALENKRRLFLDIDTRGPNAFDSLIEALRETGQDKLADDLTADNNELKPRNGGKSKVFQLATNEEEPAIYDFISTNDRLDDRDILLNINVTRSEKFHDTNNPSSYRTRSRNRGKVLIINNIDFVVEDRRRGAIADGINLSGLFRQMGLEVDYHENKTSLEMRTLINEFASNSSLKHFDMAGFVFMSHGNITEKNESTVTGTDGSGVNTVWIEQQFNNENCKHLEKKPKFFIYQTCRSPPNKEEKEQAPNFTPGINKTREDYSDMLIAHSTLPGRTSFRDTQRGTWYIELLCKIFMKHAHDHSLEELLKMVGIELGNLRTSHGSLQTSMYLNIKFKNCYFHPGIYEEDGCIKQF